MAYRRILPPPVAEGNTRTYTVPKPTEDDERIYIRFDRLCGKGTLSVNSRPCSVFTGGSLFAEIGALLTEDTNTVAVWFDADGGEIEGNVYLHAVNDLMLCGNDIRLTDDGLQITAKLNVFTVGNYVFDYVLSGENGLILRSSFTEKLTPACKEQRHLLCPEPMPEHCDVRLTISRLGVGCDTLMRRSVPCRRTSALQWIIPGSALPDDETLSLIAGLGARLNEDTPVTSLPPKAADGKLREYLHAERIAGAAAEARCAGKPICFTLACRNADEDGLIENGRERAAFGMLKKVWSENAAYTFVPSLFDAAGSLMFFPVHSFGNPKGTGITVELSDTEGKILQKQTFSSEKPEPHQVGVFAAQLPGDKPLLILKTSINGTDYSLKRLIYTGKGSILSEDITNELLQILTTE